MSLEDCTQLPGILDFLNRATSTDTLDSIVILGSSKSLKFAKNFTENSYKIAVGDVPFRAKKFGPFDLWVTTNTEFPNVWNSLHKKMITQSNCKSLALSSICLNDGPPITEMSPESLLLNSKSPYVFYFDQRHSEGSLCNPILNCCRIYERLLQPSTIQEFLKRRLRLNELQYSNGHTVTIHALALALMLKPESITFIGVDLPLHESEYTYYRPFSKVERGFIENAIYRIRQKIRRKNARETGSPFAGEIREELLNDFQSLINIAFAQGTSVKVFGRKSSLRSLKNVIRLPS
jgi:hypothetical protein